jgi:iron complex outermembrane receptor protein
MTQYQFHPRRKAGKPAAIRAAVSFTLSALVAWGYTPAHAQTSGNAAADSTLAPVVVSASRFPNDPAFPPIAATVITAEQIREAGIDNANEAIRKLGGVYGRQSSAGPNDFPLDLRGFGTNGDLNMVVLVDGVRISENELTTPLLSSIPIETIERIEIVRGGSSVLYGSGATGGTIQIITKRPQANAGHGSVVAEVGTDGQRAGRAFVARGWDNMSIDASYAKAHNDGWRDNTKSNQENFSTTVQWFASDWRFGLRANIARADFGLPGGLTQAQYDANARQANTPNNYGSYDNDSITAFLERRFGSFDVAAELAHREKISRSVYGGILTLNNVRGTQFSPRIRHVLQAGGVKNELVAGLDLAEWSNNFSTYSSDANQRSKALYLRDEVEFDQNARIAAGVRRELVNQSSVTNGYGKNTAVNAWDVQASYAIVPSLRTFAKIGQSYRIATPDENGYTNILSSGQLLKPQVSHDLEVGATWGSAGREITAKWFRHRVHNEIYYDPTIPGPFGGLGANTNLDPTRHQGVELEGRLRLTDTLQLSATYQHVEAKFIEGSNAGREVALVPKNTLSTRVNWKSGNQSADAGVRWVDRQRSGGDFENTCAKIPSFTTIDARYAVRVNAWEFALTSTNLADRKYYSQAYSCTNGLVDSIYPENGRAVKFTARYDF